MACRRIFTIVRTIILIHPNRFRWVYCQLEALRHCFPGSVRHMLEELPKSLDETYERILKGINIANREHAHRLLQCLTVAVRPLRVSELAEVLAVDFGTASGGEASKLKTEWRWEDQEDAILSTCSSLIAVVGEDEDEDGSQGDEMSQSEDGSQVVRSSHSHSSRAVQFSHFSVREFLTSPRLSTSNLDVSRFHIFLAPAHTIMASACLGTLLQLNDTSDEGGVEDKFPLARYAAEHWVTHAQFEDVSSHVREGTEILFDPDKPYFSAWIRIYDIDIKPSGTTTFWLFSVNARRSDAAPLYYAALCGFHDLVDHLINKCSHGVNAIGGVYVSPLVAALSMEKFEVAEFLYQHGAHVDVQGYDETTPLYSASRKGHLEIVQWLLRHGADPNPRQSDGWTALHWAANYGHLEVARTLLQHNADPNLRWSNGGETPLHVASRGGYTNVARLLLEQGVDVNTRSEDGSTSLHFASKRGRLEVARVLIEQGADRDAEDNEGRTPFQVAENRDMAELLSDHGTK